MMLSYHLSEDCNPDELPYYGSIFSSLLPSGLDMDERRWNASGAEKVALCFANGLSRKSIEAIAKLIREKCDTKLNTELHWHRTTNSFALYVSLAHDYYEEDGQQFCTTKSSSSSILADNIANDHTPRANQMALIEPAEQIAMLKDLLYSTATGQNEPSQVQIEWEMAAESAKKEAHEQLRYIDDEEDEVGMEERKEWNGKCESLTLTIPANTRIVSFIQSNEPDADQPPLLDQVMPLHSEFKLRWLRAGWVFASPMRVLTPPLDRIRAVFGSEIALYFSWLAHYTGCLTAPAIFGALISLLTSSWTSNQNLYAFVIFALFNTLWVIGFMKSWDHRQKRLLAEMTAKEGRRLAKEREMADNQANKYSSLHDWRLLPLDLVSLLGILAVLVALYWAQDEAEARFGPGWLVTAIIVAQGLIYLGAEFLFRMCLYKFGRKGISVEQQYEYDDGFVVRIVLFNTISCFSLLFYIAFVKSNWQRLTETLATLFITRQLVQSVTEVGIPLLISWIYLVRHKIVIDIFGGRIQKRKSSLLSTLASMSRAEKDAAKNDYDRPMDDYLEMYIQLGYILLFSSVFPLAAFCALCNNLLEARVDAFKLCYVFRRPWPRSAHKIWVWQWAIRAICYAGIFVNLALILKRCWSASCNR